MMRSRRLAPLAAGVVLVAGGTACFATRNDVRVLQSDITALRAERAIGDSARAAQIDRIIAQMSASSDSIRSLASQFGRFQGDAREALRGLREAVTIIEELTGQSQRRLQELRSAVEAARTEAQQAVAPGDTTLAPGPNQLYEIARGQLDRGSYGTARAAFEDLLRRYPTADVAADAQFYIAQAFAGERNAAAADSAYAAVVTRYPSSPRAATALYRRAQSQQSAGKTAAARALYQDLRKRYPKSDEAELACAAMTGVCPRR